MFWVFSILFVVLSIIVAFYSTFWCWIILILPEIYIVFNYFVEKRKKYKNIEGISMEANTLFQDYSYFFLYNFASKDFGGSAVILAFSGIALAIINSIYGFYLSILIALFNWYIMNFFSNKINPFNNLFSDFERELSKEIFNHFNEKTRELHYKNRKVDKSL